MSDAELVAALGKAKLNDLEAIKRLYMHYSVYEADWDTAMRWADEGAKAGDIEMREVVICHYYRYSTPPNPELAKQLEQPWAISSGCASRH